MAVFSIETPNTLFTGTSGNDSIYNTANHVTMSGGAGNDTLFNMKGNSISIDAGEGNDQAHSYEGDSIVVILGSGDDYFNAYQSKNVTVYGGDGNDEIHSSSSSKNFLIDGGKGADTIYASGIGHSVNGGVGNDTLVGVGGADSLSIEGGVGNDWIRNFADNSILLGGAGNDSIANYDKCYSNDGVLTYEGVGKNVTIEGGKGNDTITNSSENVLFKYSSGDGNDIIKGFNATSTLSIGGGYSTQASDNDVIVTVDTGKITLVGAASLSAVNIKGTKVASKLITLTEGNDTYSNTVEGATIDALGGDDSIQNGVFYLDNVWYYYGCSNVIINGGNGNDYIDNENSDNVSINGGAGNDYILTQGSLYNTTQGGIGNDSIRHNSNASVVDGGGGSDYIANSGWNVTINGGIGNDSILNSNANVSINAGSGDDKIINSNGSVWNVTINGGKGNDTIILNSDAKYAVINYNKGNGNDKIEGFNEDDTLSISGGSYSTTKSGKNIIVMVGDGKITLVGAASLSKVNIIGEKTSSETNSWTLDGTTAKYGNSNKTLVTVSGVKSTNGLSLKNKIVTVSNSSLNQKKVTVSDGYTLALGSDVSKPATKAAVWSLNGSTATYKGSYKTAGYTLASNGKSITYSKATTAETLASIQGAKSTSGLSVSGKKITLKKSALNKKVTISGGYEFDFDSDYKNATITASSNADSITNYGTKLLINGGAGNDSISNYAPKVTISGGKGNDDISNGDVNALINGDEGDDNIFNHESAENSKINGGNGDDTINNLSSDVLINGGAGDDEINNSWHNSNITINGGAGDDNIWSDGNNSSINGGAGDDWIYNEGENVLFQYNSGDGNDTIVGFKSNSTLGIGGGEYSTTKSDDNIIVTVGTGKITLVGAASLGSSLNIAGTKKVTTPATLLTVKDSTKSPVTVSSAVKVINASSRTKAVKITGNKLANSIAGGSGNDTLNGGAGNDTLTGGKGKDIFVYSAGNDLITDYTAEDKISITSGTAKVSVSGNNVIFTVGSNKITVKGGKDKTITYSDTGGKNKKYKYEETPADDEIVILPKTYFKENYTMGNGVFTLDASAVRLDLNIVGNKFANSIIGSDQNDTLKGGKANDTLTGKGGTDVFVYKSGDGNDLITDYTEEDIIHIASGTISTVKTVGKDVIFTIGNGKISLKGAADKIVSYIDAGGEHTYGDTISAVEVNGKTVTLTENYTANSFDLTGYAKTMKTINATAVTRDLTITANDNANSVLGGKGNDTLIGGKGNDTLNGKGGADIFLWNSGDGNDVITNYAEEDKIKITSGTVKTSTSGKNVILTVGSNKITVKGAADKIVTYINKNGTETGYSNTVAVKGKVATLSDKYSRSTFVAGDYSSAIRTINASKVSKNLSITGSAFADSILGGAGNDTLIGGHGNDTFKGGNGSDIFLYKKGDGNDTITDYSPGDKIKIASGTVADKVEVSGKDVIFTVNNSGTITVKNGKGKKITLIDKNGNESGKIYNSSKLWFTADDTNFDIDNQLGAIVKSSPAYSFDTSIDLPSLTQKNNFITYADKK